MHSFDLFLQEKDASEALHMYFRLDTLKENLRQEIKRNRSKEDEKEGEEVAKESEKENENGNNISFHFPTDFFTFCEEFVVPSAPRHVNIDFDTISALLSVMEQMKANGLFCSCFS